MVNFKGCCEFISSSFSVENFPVFGLYEYTFIGRSNVGKSSLINSLFSKKNLVRTSHQPGCTRSINFFTVDNALVITDVPGYGYSKVSKKESINFLTLIFSYLKKRAKLRCVYVLLDSRRGIDFKDLTIIDFLESLGQLYQLILTKSDKCNQYWIFKLKCNIISYLNQRRFSCKDILIVSSKTGEGINLLKKSILFLKKNCF